MIARTKTEIRKTLKAAGVVGDHWFGTIIDHVCWISNGYFIARLGTSAVTDILNDEGIIEIDESYEPVLSAGIAARSLVLEEGSALHPRVLDGTNLPLYAHMPDGRRLALMEKGIGVVALDQAQIDAIETISRSTITHWRCDDRGPVVGATMTSKGLEAVAILMPVRLD